MYGTTKEAIQGSPKIAFKPFFSKHSWGSQEFWPEFGFRWAELGLSPGKFRASPYSSQDRDIAEVALRWIAPS